MAKTKSYKEHLNKELKNPKAAASYLNTALEDEDPRVFLLALKDVADAMGGMSELADKSSLNRQSLYRALSENGNPKLLSILNVLYAMGFEIRIRPLTAA
jgi:probable addiction module antidote protein